MRNRVIHGAGLVCLVSVFAACSGDEDGDPGGTGASAGSERGDGDGGATTSGGADSGGGTDSGGAATGSGASSATGGADGGGGSDGTGAASSGGSGGNDDFKDVILTMRSTDCSDYVGTFTSQVQDIKLATDYEGSVEISAAADLCTLVSNSIPNHDFNDASARFATPVSEIAQELQLTRSPTAAASPTALNQGSYDAVMLNGVVLDILSAGCYNPDDPMADANGNVAIGCRATDPWLLDPLGTEGGFGTDAHNAHTQPNGLYHYHGDPMALFDDSPGADGSPVIGFASDGFPIYGSYFKDPSSGNVRKALSGYVLKSGSRPSTTGNPGGTYDGTYNDDYEFTDAGDLDECNGMTVDGQYGYYVTDSYPWVIRCLTGTPHTSFRKGGP